MLLGQAAAWGQDPNQPAEPKRSPAEHIRAIQEQAIRLIRATQQLDNWDEHYGYMLDATERMFERNGWDSESDLFALDMVRDVGEIPPWNTLARFDRGLEMIGDRYLLDGEQMAALESQAIKVNVDLFTRHSDRIMEYALEAIQTRASGEPFTPEQVARWTTLAEPVFQDARRSVNAAAQEFMEELDPEQRELMQRDLDATNRRMGDIEGMAQSWKRGEWDPHDWGMEEDPIQNPGAAAERLATAESAEPGAGQPSASGRPTSTAAPEGQAPAQEPARVTQEPKAEDPWAKYVRAFIRKYHLNVEQRQRAWLYYRDTKDRDELFGRRYKRQLEAIRKKTDAAENERVSAALRQRTEMRGRERERLFNQLKRRLERLPTRVQRKNAEPGEIGADASPEQGKAAPQPKP
jgi:hypothetical protein